MSIVISFSWVLIIEIVFKYVDRLIYRSQKPTGDAVYDIHFIFLFFILFLVKLFFFVGKRDYLVSMRLLIARKFCAKEMFLESKYSHHSKYLHFRFNEYKKLRWHCHITENDRYWTIFYFRYNDKRTLIMLRIIRKRKPLDFIIYLYKKHSNGAFKRFRWKIIYIFFFLQSMTFLLQFKSSANQVIGGINQEIFSTLVRNSFIEYSNWYNKVFKIKIKIRSLAQ